MPEFRETTLDALCRTLAEAATHKELTLLLSECSLEEQGGFPKWERMLLALTHRQKRDRCGNNVVAFLCAVLHPSRFAGKSEEFENFRSGINFHLSFQGLSVDDRGQIQRVAAASTLPEASQRANELRAELTHRAVHRDVLRFCRVEFLQDNYFHCVLEATKSVFQKIRDLASVEGDGAALVDQAFSVNVPILALNALQTESEKSEQKGFAHLLKGVFGTFRNVLAHAPKVNWAVNRADTLDALTILSYLHRRLDGAVVVPNAAATV